MMIETVLMKQWLIVSLNENESMVRHLGGFLARDLCPAS